MMSTMIRSTARLLGPLALALTVIAVASSASPTAGRVATSITATDQPAFVQVRVNFNGQALTASQVVLTTNRIFSSGVGQLAVSGVGMTSSASPLRALGLRVVVTSSRSGLTITARARKRRFILVGYATPSPHVLMIELWKSAPPSLNATILNDHCLHLTRVSSNPGLMMLGGVLERHVFENRVSAIVRGHTGVIVGERAITASVGHSFAATIHYTHVRGQTGTVQLVVLSAKDGAVQCLAQQAERISG
jgi:hypothetical protein